MSSPRLIGLFSGCVLAAITGCSASNDLGLDCDPRVEPCVVENTVIPWDHDKPGGAPP